MEVTIRAGPAHEAVVDVPAAEEKGPPVLPPLVERRLVNLETFIIVFVAFVFLLFEEHIPFVGCGCGCDAMRIRMVSPDEVV